jgi:triacylglycerol lipase
LQKKRLEARGLGPIFTINLGYPFKSICTYAEKVKLEVDSISKITGRKDLILIGHSMGGLISCWYGTQMAPPNTVTDIITIGSPFYGTPVARIGLGANAREMEPHSPLLERLLDAVATHPSLRFYHIASKTDQLILPGASAALPQHEHVIYEDIGHASLLYSQRVTDKLSDWLVNRCTVASDCNLNP